MDILGAGLMAGLSVALLGMQIGTKGPGSLAPDTLLMGLLLAAAIPLEKYFHSKLDVLVTDAGIRVGRGNSGWMAPLWRSGFRAWTSLRGAEWAWGGLPAHRDLLALQGDAPDLVIRLADYVPAGSTKQQIASHRAMLKKRRARSASGRSAAPPGIEALPLFGSIEPLLRAHAIQTVPVRQLGLSKQVDLTASREGKHVLALMAMLGAFVLMELVVRTTKTAPVLWEYSLFVAAILATASFMYLRKGRMPYAEAVGVSLVLLAVAVPAAHEFAERLNMWADGRPSADMDFRYVGASTLEPVAADRAPPCVPEPLVADGYASYWASQEKGSLTRLPVYCGLGFWQIDIRPLADRVRGLQR